MAVTIVKNGLSMFIVGTSKVEILDQIVKEKYPTVKAMIFNSSDSTYHLIAETR